jgi:DNA-binding transcriptional MerR regulator/methylmalonyl-CoA mutase cobalamin-binding subunit
MDIHGFVCKYKHMPKETETTSNLSVTYPVRTVVGLTGLSPDLLRAWERRHGVVIPERTDGGTRRYRASDVERLRFVKAAVDSGHRIGVVANLSNTELQILSGQGPDGSPAQLDGMLDAVESFDSSELQRLLSVQLSTLGAPRFARDVAQLMLAEIGERWARGEIGIANEHMACVVIRNLLGPTLQSTAISDAGPKIVFATPPEERHELGLMMAMLTTLSAGANCLYLGADLTVEEVVIAAQEFGADVVVMHMVMTREIDARRLVTFLRSELEDHVQIWTGGSASAELDDYAGVEYIASLETLEQRMDMVRDSESSGS